MLRMTNKHSSYRFSCSVLIASFCLCASHAWSASVYSDVELANRYVSFIPPATKAVATTVDAKLEDKEESVQKDIPYTGNTLFTYRLNQQLLQDYNTSQQQASWTAEQFRNNLLGSYSATYGFQSSVGISIDLENLKDYEDEINSAFKYTNKYMLFEPASFEVNDNMYYFKEPVFSTDVELIGVKGTVNVKLSTYSGLLVAPLGFVASNTFK